MYQWFTYDTTTGAVGKHEQDLSPLINDQFDSNLIHTGQAILGPYDDTNPMPNAYLPAWSNPQAYLYQNSAFAANPSWPAMELAQAQQAQIANLNAGLAATFAGGFTAKTLVGGATSPHTYPTNQNAQANFTAAVTAFTANPNKTTVTIETLDAGWVSHTKAEFFGVFTDGDNWKEAQYAQYNVLLGQVEAQTTPPTTPVVWTTATY